MDVFTILNKKIEEEVTHLTIGVVSGACSHDEYKTNTGKIRGLRAAAKIINDLAKAMQHGEDEDE
jgi:hypothetical protein